MPIVKKQTQLSKKLQEKTHYVGFRMPLNLHQHLTKQAARNRRSFSAEIICKLEYMSEEEGYSRDLAQ